MSEHSEDVFMAITFEDFVNVIKDVVVSGASRHASVVRNDEPNRDPTTTRRFLIEDVQGIILQTTTGAQRLPWFYLEFEMESDFIYVSWRYKGEIVRHLSIERRDIKTTEVNLPDTPHTRLLFCRFQS